MRPWVLKAAKVGVKRSRWGMMRSLPGNTRGCDASNSTATYLFQSGLLLLLLMFEHCLQNYRQSLLKWIPVKSHKMGLTMIEIRGWVKTLVFLKVAKCNFSDKLFWSTKFGIKIWLLLNWIKSFQLTRDALKFYSSKSMHGRDLEHSYKTFFCSSWDPIAFGISSEKFNTHCNLIGKISGEKTNGGL